MSQEIKTIYIIGGASRSGKTLLREKLLVEKNIEGISTDILQAVIEKRQTSKEDKYKGGDLAEHMWPYINSLIMYQAKYSTNGFCIEGDLIHPEYIQRVHSDIKLIPVFLGYPNASIESKLNDVRVNRKDNDWTFKLSEDELKNHVINSISFSRKLEDDCQDLGIKFIDVSKDFERQLDIAAEYLLNRLDADLSHNF